MLLAKLRCGAKPRTARARLDIGKAVPDVADAGLTEEDRPHFAPSHGGGNLLRDRLNIDCIAAADVENLAKRGTVEREDESPRHVVHMNEITALGAVLIHLR